MCIKVVQIEKGPKMHKYFWGSYEYKTEKAQYFKALLKKGQKLKGKSFRSLQKKNDG